MKKMSSMTLLLLIIITHSVYGSYSGSKVKSSTSKAKSSDPKAKFKDGFYSALSVGADWGYANWSGVNTISLVDDINDTNGLFQFMKPHGKKQDGEKVIGSIGLGYQVVDARLYLGSQISYTVRGKHRFDLNNLQIFNILATEGLPPLSTVSGSSQILSSASLIHHEFDVDLKPGCLISKNLVVYARAGAAFTKLKIKSSGEWTESSSENQLEIQTGNSSHNSKVKMGFRVGAGTEYLIFQHLGLSLDYIYSNYGKIRTLVDSQTTGFFDFNQVFGLFVSDVKVTTQTLMMGFVVHF